MTNQPPPSELLDLKTHILACMADYMPSLVDNDVRIPLNLTACELALKKHLEGVFLESAWEDPLAIVFEIRWVLNHLGSGSFEDFVSGAFTLPPDAQAQEEFLKKCREVFDISLARLLEPAANADIPMVINALRRAMLALAFLNLDAICDDVQTKAPGYHPYCYTEAELAQCDAILSHYLETVQAPALRNDEASIMAAVQHAVESLNDLNDRCGRSLIETDAREDICKLIQCAAQSAGLDRADSDVTDEWRDW
ncbi:hypothetical protein INH39_07680 [Massilia violaceinigra]|uniref:Uncharacterized protein n=1 Tax=Massilia violaceinigra TaxID=2045208 RepID=A0ABY4AD10_9BURK|nr:hypothetical protein [Massilia violaceinigra]UOD31559.1 hypothetical protein INH39_07680 [Massilia violaceinigra]